MYRAERIYGIQRPIMDWLAGWLACATVVIRRRILAILQNERKEINFLKYLCGGT